MTVQHDQRYATASVRNVTSRLGYKPTADYKIAFFSGMELEDLKHNVGVRKNDTKFDVDLGPWLASIKAHAEKAGITAKAKKKDAPTVVAELQEGQTIANLVAAPTVTPTTKVVYDAKASTFDASAEKKVNPKKAQREAAIASSGMAPGKRINADQQRADAMPAKAKRTPRIMTKQ